MRSDTERAEFILVEAVDIESPEARAAYVDEACSGNEVLKGEVNRLLQNYFLAGSLLDNPNARGTSTSNSHSSSDVLGTVIGPYKLREVLGEGGMGTVFVAEQEHPVRRKVALKLIKLGMDSRDVISRFQSERQALARMDHPNIARVLDGGMTESGRPYFVMQMVKGLCLTDHCDSQKAGTAERLQLFLQVCRAIQHAHQKGIIHRDLKPTNVLVAIHDTIPVVKVIDFGVAKAIGEPLTEHTLYTGVTQLLGTPLYMSPEQAGGSSLDVDTRSDVYSLGVMLYELLTGCTPFEKDLLKQAGVDELRRIIKDVDPLRPSARFSTLHAAASTTIAQNRSCEVRQLGQQLRGELDWIVMKALEKDRNRRYESVSALASDIERYLDNQPVEACPPSTLYRFRKYAVRNKGLLSAALVVAVVALVGTSFSVWFGIKAGYVSKLADERLVLANNHLIKEREARADADRHKANATANLGHALDAVEQLLTRVEDKRLATTPGGETVRQALIRDAIRFYETFLKAAPDEPELQLRLALAWSRLAKLHESLYQPNPSQSAHLNAIKLLDQLHGKSPEDPEIAAALAEEYGEFGHTAHWVLGQFDSALQALNKSIELWRGLHRQFPDNDTYQWKATHALNALSDNHKVNNRLDDAEKTLREAIAIQRKILQKGNISSPARYAHCASFSLLANLLDARGRELETEQVHLEVIQGAEKLLAQDPGATSNETCAPFFKSYGDYLQKKGRLLEAEQYYQKATALFAELPRLDPTNLFVTREHAALQTSFASLLFAQGRYQEAFPLCRSASDLMRPTALLSDGSSQFNSHRNQADECFLECIHELVKSGHRASAEKVCDELIHAGAEPPLHLLAQNLAVRSWRVIGDTERAAKLFEQSVKAIERVHGERADRIQMGKAIFSVAAGRYYLFDFETALPLYNDSLLWNPGDAETLNHRGYIFLEQGHYDKAIADFDDSLRSGAALNWITLGYRARAHFRLKQHSRCFADLAQRLTQRPNDVQNLTLIDRLELAACTDQDFRRQYSTWFDQAQDPLKSSVDARLDQVFILAERSEVRAADDILARIEVQQDVPSSALFKAGLLALRIGRAARYRDFCRRLVKGIGPRPQVKACWDIAWTSVISPQALEDFDQAVAAATRAATFEPDMCRSQLILGGVLFRAGRYQDAITHLSRALATKGGVEVQKAHAGFLLAMSHRHLGNVDASKRSYEAALKSTERLLGTTSTPLRWTEQMTLHLLQEEAGAVLSEPSIPSGK
jgi:serine/threonine protein kinase